MSEKDRSDARDDGRMHGTPPKKQNSIVPYIVEAVIIAGIAYALYLYTCRQS